MAQEAIRGVSPAGRIIWGSVSEKQTEGYQGAKYEAGEEPIQFGLAVLKTDPNVVAMMLQPLFNQAVAGYPNNNVMANRIQQEWASGFTMGMFKFKIRDGDKPNDQGVVNPNSKGCWVFNFSTKLPLKACNAQNIEIDPKLIKRGYYADVSWSAKVNELTDANAGIFLNPQIVRLLAFGEEIVGGPSIEQAFANHAAPTNLPPGASAVPVAGAMPAGGPGSGAGMMPGNVASAGAMPGSGPGSVPGASPSNGMPGNGGNTPSPGGPGNLTTSSPSNRPRFDPNTGAPIHYPDEVAAAPAPRFDPNTGQPIQPAAPAAPAMRFDPNTGQPINPNTGAPVMPHTAFVGGPGQG